MAKNSILEICDIIKLYNKNVGIKDISLKINPKDIVAVIGPNGSGKTTLVRAIGGLSRIDKGSILLEHNPTFQCRAEIGYMPEELQFYEQMTIAELLEFICTVKFSSKYSEEIDRYLKSYNLYTCRNERISKLSLGMKKKVSIVMALIGNSKLIILDEPTNGIDTESMIQLKSDLRMCRQQNKMVILTSHVLDWVENICNRYIFLKEGKIVGDFSREELSSSLENLYQQLYE